MSNRWHEYSKHRLKTEAQKVANRIKRKSVHRNKLGFKVRVRTVGRKGQRFPDRCHIVEWYGTRTAM